MNLFQINTFKVLIAVFLLHGALVFFFPDQYHNRSGWLVYIKYLVFFAGLLICANRLFVSRQVTLYFSLVFTSFLFGTIISSKGNLVINDFLYIIPIFTILIAGAVNQQLSLKFLVSTVIVFSFVFAVLEFAFFSKILSVYSRHVMRTSSIFSNPNNLAIILGLLTVLITSKSLFSSQKQLFYLGISSITMILSGSKTGILLFILSFIIYIIHQNRARNTISFIILSIPLIIFGGKIYYDKAISAAESLNLRGMELKSGENRLMAYDDFFSSLDTNVLFPRWEHVVHLDNAYIHMWGNLGLITLFLFLLQHLFIGLCAFKKSDALFILHCCFTLSLLTTNMLYIWPASYIYWFFCAHVLLQPTNNKLSPKLER